MSLLTIFVVLIVVGVGLWVVNTYIPMEAGIKKLLNIVAVVFLVVWLLYGLFGGAIHQAGNIKVGG